MTETLSRKRRFHLALLFLLYLSQGLPFGFQATALPVFLRQHNLSLTAIGVSGMLALPWALKALWAPLVDRYYLPWFGRRKSWIIPMQICLIISTFTASIVCESGKLTPLLILIFFMNLFAATQDIAVDGLAVDLLAEKDLGPGNAAQVIGYKAGMLISSGVLVYFTPYTGWKGLFGIMAVISILPLPMLLIFSEKSEKAWELAEKLDIKKMIYAFGQAVRLPGAVGFMMMIATYKTGEVMIDVMFKPFLLDNGFTPSQIGLYIGTIGMAASVAGSFTGGMAGTRFPLMRLLFMTILLRMVPLVGEWLITLSTPSTASVLAVTLAEHFIGGMLTTILFACMMSRVDKRIGATHYTIFASIEVAGKSPGAWMAGSIADRFGYSILFSCGILISLLPLMFISRTKKN